MELYVYKINRWIVLLHYNGLICPIIRQPKFIKKLISVLTARLVGAADMQQGRAGLSPQKFPIPISLLLSLPLVDTSTRTTRWILGLTPKKSLSNLSSSKTHLIFVGFFLNRSVKSS